ncbi:YncE family protein [Puniceibacterium sediminis]|uniref:40-residue YVTN family beta-propeller repeat-containing protein n=1 Tax=Puniceibacterium sediminis TaxID=1608407 RepID=A0A238X6S5_9RHOB|nr:ATP-binding protein [Puniceibacterium sediminis]SNR54637.1 40-residue YVTN family beta-propeller repeat-containing protein [Puniceibacterium sediminis]
MAQLTQHRLRSLLGATAVAMTMAATPAFADTLFTPVVEFSGMVRAAAVDGGPVYKGSKVSVTGQRLVPGQQITLMRGTTVLNADGPLVADTEGKFSFELTVDEEAAIGLQPILLIAENPAAAEIVTMKISPLIPLSGQDLFDVTSAPVTSGLYQVAYSAASDAVFVASAVGRPPVKQSALTKIDATTMEVLAEVTPAAAPARADGSDGGVFAVYGVAVDDINGTVWVTNTRQNSVAVYQQADLSLIKQFEPGTVGHPRDVVVDTANERAYASSTGTGLIEVFDTRTLEKLAPIEIKSRQRGGAYSAMSLDLDSENGKLVNVSMKTDEAALIDLATGDVSVLPLKGAKGAAGAAYDARENLIFVVSQQSDNLLIVNAETGAVLHDTPVGAQPLNVTFDPVSRLAYVSVRSANTIAVVNTKGELVANLDGGSRPNQLRADGHGHIWAVNKTSGKDDPKGDRLSRISPVAQ